MKTWLAVGGVLAVCTAAWAEAIPFSLNNNGTSSWWLDSGSVGPLGGDNPNPTLTLNIGERYEVTVINFGPHLFELLAMGSDDSQDAVLLSQGDADASFNRIPDVNFTGFGAAVSQFTLTPALAAAMTNAGLSQSPGYRCDIHTSSMRGDILLVPEPASLVGLALGGVAFLRRRR